jgi:prepilin peptidase CpaA
MTLTAAAACAVLLVTAGLLLYGAVKDLRDYSISNAFVLVLGALFILHAVLSGRWVIMHENIAFALLMFAVLLVCYARGWMGGGDVKLLTVACLWVGIRCALPFSFFLLIFATLHTAAIKLKWVEGRRAGGQLKIAFAPSINAALIGGFASGCLASPVGRFCI